LSAGRLTGEFRKAGCADLNEGLKKWTRLEYEGFSRTGGERKAIASWRSQEPDSR